MIDRRICASQVRRGSTGVWNGMFVPSESAREANINLIIRCLQALCKRAEVLPDFRDRAPQENCAAPVSTDANQVLIEPAIHATTR
jgi:hypothetical protein